MLTLNIIGEPVAWSMATIAPRHKYEPPPHKAWQELIRLQAVTQIPSGHKPWDCPVLVTKIIVRRTRPKSNKDPYPHKRPDLDNLEKAFFDALSGMVYVDDARIVKKVEPQKIWATPEHPAGIEAQFEPLSRRE